MVERFDKLWYYLGIVLNIMLLLYVYFTDLIVKYSCC